MSGVEKSKYDLSEKRRVKLTNVSKSFGNLQVVDNLSLEVFEGQFMCIVGPSGCGKTTFLKMIAGLEQPSSGSILVDGLPPKPESHNIGFVFQEESLLPWRNVYENVRFGLEIRRGKSKKIDRAAEEIVVSEMIKLVGLSGFEKYYPDMLSGGMRKRVSIARALSVMPSILLMDEPFGDLDAQTRWIMHKELKSIHERLGKTVVFVTHDVEESVYLADVLLVFTKRPARIKKIIPIELPEPRNKLNEQFVKYREMIIGLLREELPYI